MKHIAFILTMPGNNSWNGKWSGNGKLFVKVRSLSTAKKNQAKIERALKDKYYGYSWSDGWRASVEVKEVDGLEKKRLTKNSQGFLGYDWMIDSILCNGEIKTS